MSGFASVFKTLFIPAIISLFIYLLLTFALLPLLRRHRATYHQYLPLPLHALPDSLTSGAHSLRHRMSDALVSFFVPTWWQKRGLRSVVVDGSMGPGGPDDDDDDSALFGDEEGEGLVGLDVNGGRREALERRRSAVGEEERRLSRELEEGFRDDSDNED